MPTKQKPIEKKYADLEKAVKTMRMAQKARENATDTNLKNSHTALAKKQENKVDKLLSN